MDLECVVIMCVCVCVFLVYHHHLKKGFQKLIHVGVIVKTQEHEKGFARIHVNMCVFLVYALINGAHHVS